MRLGGPVFQTYQDPAGWVKAVQALNYRAAYCPLDVETKDTALIRSYEKAAKEAEIVIAEVGTWCNTLSPDAAVRRTARERCKQGLWLADEIGAHCCVNIAGSLGQKWDGPCAKDLTSQTFEMIVEMVREIVDAVKPSRSFYTLETMPWMYPETPDRYLQLIQAIDRPAFAVHLDLANMINSPLIYFNNTALIKESFAKLGPRIKSCHAKDILLGENMTTHLDEVRPGLGKLDYTAILSEMARLDADLPLMLEHLPNAEEYRLAAEYIRGLI
jgi:sugar phosphate isomerase/epimerase